MLQKLLLCVSFLVANQLNAVEPDSQHSTIQKMLDANNIIRQQHKLNHHNFSTALAKAAQNHAWYMARMHDSDDEDFNHRGGNGTPGQRASRFAYAGLVKENIARGYKSIESVFEAWQKSHEHARALLSDTIDVGFGYAKAKDGTTYWVAVYGRSEKWDLTNLVSRSSKESIQPFLLISCYPSNR